MNRLIPLTTAILILLASTCWAGDAYQAKVIGIADGDTIKVLHNGQEVRIRLYGIDAPESHQAFGNRAKQFTADKAFGKTVMVTPMGTDRYGRTVALIDLQNDTRTLNEALIEVGLAWVYRKYCKAEFCTDWLTVEDVAKFSGHGLWSDPNPIPPWEFRRR